MNIFWTADLHLGHDEHNGMGGIIRHAKRPFSSIGDMDEAIISNWNEYVQRKDIVYIVGDFAWKNHNKYLARLKGKKILIRGNHDRMNQDSLRNFTEVYDLLSKRIDGKIVIMCHYCMKVWDRSCHGSWHVYGHSHGRIGETPHIPRCDVGVDVWDYRPIPWEVLKKKLERRVREHCLGRKGDIGELELNTEKNRIENLALLKEAYEPNQTERSLC